MIFDQFQSEALQTLLQQLYGEENPTQVINAFHIGALKYGELQRNQFLRMLSWVESNEECLTKEDVLSEIRLQMGVVPENPDVVDIHETTS